MVLRDDNHHFQESTMLVQSRDTGGFDAPQALALVEEAWVTEVLPRLPAALAEQARALKALQRVRAAWRPRTISCAACWPMAWGTSRRVG